MLKYALFGLAAGFALIVAGFVVLARWNDRDAEAGPTPVFVLTVNVSSTSPERLEVEEDRLIELRVVNRADLVRAVRIESSDVESLPVETTREENATSQPIPGFQLLVGPGDTGATFVRFKASGEYQLRIETPGRAETLTIVTVIAH